MHVGVMADRKSRTTRRDQGFRIADSIPDFAWLHPGGKRTPTFDPSS
jgi:hypothetical protein